MSRRTKLLITALFLVLLGIPVAYIALSWSVQDPLQFRILEDRRGNPKSLGHPFVVEVRNTSAAPIVLKFTRMMKYDANANLKYGNDMGGFLSFRVRPPDYPLDTQLEYNPIAPHSTAYYAVGWQSGLDRLFGSPGDFRMHYVWCTSSQDRICSLRLKLAEHLPDSLHQKLFFSFDKGTYTPLDVSILRFDSPSTATTK